MVPMAEARSPWSVDAGDFPRAGSPRDRLAFLLRYAILAPSTHNTQPWRFEPRGELVRVLADDARWLHVADPDRRELHISLGCAIENLVVAARRFGYGCSVEYPPEPDPAAAVVRLEPGAPGDEPIPPDDLFDALTMRKTSHREFDDREVPREATARLLRCCGEDDVALLVSSDPELRRSVHDLVVLADAMLFADPAWRDELAHWIASGAFGTPWLMGKMAQLALHHLDPGRAAGRRDSTRVTSAPLLGVVASRLNDRPSQVRVGRVFERVYLTASTLGLALQPLSQVLELPSTKAALASALALDGFLPQQTFRVGYGVHDPDHTPRRPVEDVIG